MDVWGEIDAERKEMVSLLESLDESQWETQSLCGEWKVRHVVGHLIKATEANVGSFLTGLVQNGFNVNRFLAREGVKAGSVPAPDLLERYRSIIGDRHKPPGVRPLDMLTDSLTHQQDVRRALGVPREIPADRLRAVADNMRGKQFVIGSKKRVSGLTLRATDTDWSNGEGPEVSGPLEALFMGALMGRGQALNDLDGPGKETLAARL